MQMSGHRTLRHAGQVHAPPGRDAGGKTRVGSMLLAGPGWCPEVVPEPTPARSGKSIAAPCMSAGRALDPAGQVYRPGASPMRPTASCAVTWKLTQPNGRGAEGYFPHARMSLEWRGRERWVRLVAGGSLLLVLGLPTGAGWHPESDSSAGTKGSHSRRSYQPLSNGSGLL